MKTTKILALFTISNEEREYIDSKISDSSIEIYDTTENTEQIDYAKSADIIVGRRVTLEILEAAQNLKLYIFPGTGVDGLMETFSRYSKKKSVRLVNTHRSSYNCAEHAVAMLFGLTHHLKIHDHRMRIGESPQRNPTTTLLKDKTVGLLGYGPINQYVYRFLQNFDLEFRILKRTPDPSIRDMRIFTPNELHTFLEEVDILFIGMPLTNETRDFIGKKELELLGPQSYLINVSRGAIINQEALYYAMKNNKIAGAGLDVWYRYEGKDGLKYGFDPKYRFGDLDNVILSPHRANSGGDITRWDPVLEHIKKFALKEEELNHQIDIELGY